MRKLFNTLVILLPLLAIFSHPLIASAAIEEVKINGLDTRAEKGCYWDTARKGVLVDHPIVNAPTSTPTPAPSPGTPPPAATSTPDTTFNCYVRVFLNGNSALIITVAVIIVVFSGIQYMLALGNSGNQGKAKQRIVSVITGVIFLTLIRFFLRLIGT